MNDFNAKQIRKLRNDGLGYRKIANLLDLSLTVVKRYCKSNPHLKGYGRAVRAMVLASKKKGQLCKECLKPIEQPRKGRTKQFCSDTCRRKYWVKQHPEKADSYICKECGKPFSDYGNPNRKYCSRTCTRTSRRIK